MDHPTSTSSPTPTAPSRGDILFQIAALEALLEKLDGVRGSMRDHIKSGIAAEYDESGEKCAVDVRIPGTKETVAKVSTTVSKDKVTVDNREALKAFVRATAPTELKYETVTTINPAYEARLLSEITWEPDPADPTKEIATLVNEETGEATVVPGVTKRLGNKVTAFSILSRRNDRIMEYLESIDIAAVLGRSHDMIESFATVTGEVAEPPAEAAPTEPEAPASEAVVSGEVVAREDAA